jgi:hypothetical protein
MGGPMRRYFKLLIPAAVVVSIGMGPAVPAFAGGSGAQKAPLVHNDEEFCGGGLSFPPPPVDHGFAVINAHRGVISAEVSLKNAKPNTTYGVEVVQTPSGTGCNVYTVGSLTTNGQGNGHVFVSVPQNAGDTDAFVGLFYGNFHDFYNSPDVTLS